MLLVSLVYSPSVSESVHACYYYTLTYIFFKLKFSFLFIKSLWFILMNILCPHMFGLTLFFFTSLACIRKYLEISLFYIRLDLCILLSLYDVQSFFNYTSKKNFCSVLNFLLKTILIYSILQLLFISNNVHLF